MPAMARLTSRATIPANSGDEASGFYTRRRSVEHLLLGFVPSRHSMVTGAGPLKAFGVRVPDVSTATRQRTEVIGLSQRP